MFDVKSFYYGLWFGFVVGGIVGILIGVVAERSFWKAVAEGGCRRLLGAYRYSVTRKFHPHNPDSGWAG